MIDVALLGTGGMMPLPGRFLTSMLCRINGSMLLVDCGEGTQVTLKKLGWGFKNIDGIAITHFHADHISGLPGLLLAIGNAERTEPLKMFGPPGLARVVKSLRVIVPELPFDIHFTEWSNENTSCFFMPDVELKSVQLHHWIPCFGYSLTMHRRGRFDLERAKQSNIPMAVWSPLQKQDEIIYEGVRYTGDMVLGSSRKGLMIGYCTDTRPVQHLPQFMFGADLLICEGLYGDESKQEKATAHKHMSFREAATIAKEAKVKELWLTHFSPAMPDPHNYIHEATKIFSNTIVGRDRMTKTLIFEEVPNDG
ncbi:MAG: ribonuclease Z [Defluviitaleaceae bacterium]|nr:ribonuclease Z [Defluviitaleaceae bacterium]